MSITHAYFLAAATLKFNGGESMSLRYSESIMTEADNLSIRFRTVGKYCYIC